MADLTGAYNPEAEASQEFSCIPTADYLAQIVDSDMKPTNKNDGHYLELAYEIADGEYKGRKLWVRLNLDNQNAKAVEIANRDFAAIREATGILNPRKSEELHYIPHVIRVEFIKAGETRGKKTFDRDTNEVKAWKKTDATIPFDAGARAGSGTPSAGAEDSLPPWKRNQAA